MNIFSNKNFIKKDYIYLFFIFLFSFFINFYYSNIGVYPIDTFLHYDAAYRILNGEFPVKDYWISMGFLVDIIQSIFFKILGINWFAYQLHSSIFNVFVSIFSYYFFLSFNLSKLQSTIYTFSVAILAYTISGTPFQDHHAIFFLLLSTYLIVFVLNSQVKNYIWILIVMLFFLSFLSKQVPAAYAVLSQGIILTYFFVQRKKMNIFKIIFLSSTFFLLLFTFILIYLKIDLKSFYIQYVDYPRSFGSSRYSDFTKSYEIFFNQYKYLLLPLIIILIIKIKKIINKEINLSSKETIIFLIVFTFGMSLLLHQLMSKNQIFIYFLIPIFFALLESEIKTLNIKGKKYFSIILIALIIFITIKYHYRFNETRKFHELETVNLGNSVSASQIDKSLKGLKWITPLFKNNISDEISMLKETKKRIEKIKYEIMFITEYKFLDSITQKKLNYPARAFTVDGSVIPKKDNKFYDFYKKFLLNKINENNIQEVYFLKLENLPRELITDYIDESCYILKEDQLFYIFKINCLN
tara:strand:+ start:354 stop:1928 length:1575 start_codon:yes stop_codon:yes gene_type:complete